MEVVRQEHSTSRELLKQQLVAYTRQQGFDSAFMWNNFAFTGNLRGTNIQGEILTDAIHVEVSGRFEKMVAGKLREGWQKFGKSNGHRPSPEDSEAQIGFSEHPTQGRGKGQKNMVAILERLADFKERGIITEQEFQTQKHNFLERL